jgi:hypothetical protein
MEEQTNNNNFIPPKIVRNVLTITDSCLNNKKFQKGMDVLRILLFIIAIIILVVLVTNINEVKILNSNVCALCQNWTGATCIAKDILLK